MAYLIDVDAKVPLATGHPYSLGKRICISNTGVLFKAFLNLDGDIEIHRSLNQGQNWEQIAIVEHGNAEIYNGFCIETNYDGSEVGISYLKGNNVMGAVFDVNNRQWIVLDVDSGKDGYIPNIYYNELENDFGLEYRENANYRYYFKLYYLKSETYCDCFEVYANEFPGGTFFAKSSNKKVFACWFNTMNYNYTPYLIIGVGEIGFGSRFLQLSRSGSPILTSLRIVNDNFYSNIAYLLKYGSKTGDGSIKNLHLTKVDYKSNSNLQILNNYDITPEVSSDSDEQIVLGHFDMGIDGAGNIYILYVKSIPNNYLFMRTFDTQTETLSDEIQLTDFKVLAPSILTASLPNSNKIYYTYIRDV